MVLWEEVVVQHECQAVLDFLCVLLCQFSLHKLQYLALLALGKLVYGVFLRVVDQNI